MAAVFDRRRPDLELGVFETMLVLGGRPVEPDAHLSRLSSSLEALFPAHTPPPLDVPGVMPPYGRRTTGTSEPGAVRITVAPNCANELEARIVTREVERELVFGTGSAALHSLPLPGGLGAHKWADRSLLDEAQAGLPDRVLPLIVDRDGAVLEASRANVFAVLDGALLTPPADGRILPGVTRARVLDLATAMGVETHEAKLGRDDLFAADEVFLTGSVRGVERVETLDGAALAAGGEVTGRVATELRRTWAGDRFG